MDPHPVLDALAAEDFADRPEIRAALAGRFGSATRLARSPRSQLDTVHLFVALRRARSTLRTA